MADQTATMLAKLAEALGTIDSRLSAMESRPVGKAKPPKETPAAYSSGKITLPALTDAARIVMTITVDNAKGDHLATYATEWPKLTTKQTASAGARDHYTPGEGFGASAPLT